MMCAKCRREVTAYFKVERVAHGNVILTSELCSVVCMLQWTYDFATLQGAQAAAGVKQKIDAAKTAFTALKDAFKGR